MFILLDILYIVYTYILFGKIVCPILYLDDESAAFPNLTVCLYTLSEQRLDQMEVKNIHILSLWQLRHFVKRIWSLKCFCTTHWSPTLPFWWLFRHWAHRRVLTMTMRVVVFAAAFIFALAMSLGLPNIYSWIFVLLLLPYLLNFQCWYVHRDHHHCH